MLLKLSVFRRSASIMISLVASLLFTTIPAHAEGALTGTFTNASVGQGSARWYDNNYDGSGTWIYLTNCRASDGVNAAVAALYRANSAGPDYWKGDRTYTNCYTSQSNNWGQQTPAGQYYFVLSKIGLSSVTRINANYSVHY